MKTCQICGHKENPRPGYFCYFKRSELLNKTYYFWKQFVKASESLPPSQPGKNRNPSFLEVWEEMKKEQGADESQFKFLEGSKK